MSCVARIQISQDESERCGSCNYGGTVDGEQYCNEHYQWAKDNSDKRKASIDDSVKVTPEGERIRFMKPYYIHMLCGGYVDLLKVSETNNVLVCRACGLRVYMPNSFETWEQQKEWLFRKGNGL